MVEIPAMIGGWARLEDAANRRLGQGAWGLKIRPARSACVSIPGRREAVWNTRPDSLAELSGHGNWTMVTDH
ncbi:hypothetical protein RRG08_046071 [Elysia crispata]|uniref:Uncharacterized protein n=1 Tax=Elysia crispata TaxID=231223 RepID=A0AAE0Y5D2_9GAST|nr:hypothetical protein RRG08_046071 [Elysia crispata]